MLGTRELLPGTLDMLILKALSLGPAHGYGVLLRIEETSRGLLTLEQGSLYPALARLESRGVIVSEWGRSENNRRAKFYSITPAGTEQLQAETENWERVSGVVHRVLQPVSGS